MSLQTPEGVRRLQRALSVKAKQEPEFRFYLLYDKVYREDILAHAYQRSRAARGAAGVDGVEFADIEAAGVESWLAALRTELQAQTYRPSPVRRVMIPKPGGGERPLGIPTIRDRVVQTAVKLVLEPIFEADFEESAEGYRPQRSAQDAVQVVHAALCEGYTDVVDADLSKYFDTIPHQELLQSVARRVVDRQILHLVKRWLKVPVEERDAQGRRRRTGGKRSTRGTPHGGVISPLLANIYLPRFLRAWRQRDKGRQYRARVISSADDFVMVSRGQAAAALAWTRDVMTRIGLTLNDAKTSIRNARTETFDVLGYTLGAARWPVNGRWYLTAKPSKKSQQRVKAAVRGVLHPGNQQPWPQVVADLNRRLRGWAQYFNYGSRAHAYQAVDRYVTAAVRQFLRRRHHVPTRGTRRFSDVYGELGVLSLGSLRRSSPA